MLSAVVRFLWDIFCGLMLGLGLVASAFAAFAGALEAWSWYGRPPLIRGVPGTFFRVGVPNHESAFNERLQTAFRTGMPEADLLQELETQGFETCRLKKYASFFTYDPTCRVGWHVYWKASEFGTVTKVWGSSRPSCL
jgi:hypothetical protein